MINSCYPLAQRLKTPAATPWHNKGRVRVGDGRWRRRAHAGGPTPHRPHPHAPPIDHHAHHHPSTPHAHPSCRLAKAFDLFLPLVPVRPLHNNDRRPSPPSPPQTESVGVTSALWPCPALPPSAASLPDSGPGGAQVQPLRTSCTQASAIVHAANTDCPKARRPLITSDCWV